MGDMIVQTTLLENINDPCIKKTVIFKNMFHSVLYACQRVEFCSITLHINQPVRRPQQNKLVDIQGLLGISTSKFWLATSLMLVGWFRNSIVLLTLAFLQFKSTLFLVQSHVVLCKLHSPFPVWNMVSSFPHVFSFFPIKHGFPTKSQCSIMFPWFVFPMFFPCFFHKNIICEHFPMGFPRFFPNFSPIVPTCVSATLCINTAAPLATEAGSVRKAKASSPERGGPVAKAVSTVSDMCRASEKWWE